MKPIIHQTSTADLRAENRIVKGGQVRDVDAQPDFAAGSDLILSHDTRCRRNQSLVADRVPPDNDGYSLRTDNQHDGRRVRLR